MQRVDLAVVDGAAQGRGQGGKIAELPGTGKDRAAGLPFPSRGLEGQEVLEFGLEAGRIPDRHEADACQRVEPPSGDPQGIAELPGKSLGHLGERTPAVEADRTAVPVQTIVAVRLSSQPLPEDRTHRCRPEGKQQAAIGAPPQMVQDGREQGPPGCIIGTDDVGQMLVVGEDPPDPDGGPQAAFQPGFERADGPGPPAVAQHQAAKPVGLRHQVVHVGHAGFVGVEAGPALHGAIDPAPIGFHLAKPGPAPEFQDLPLGRGTAQSAAALPGGRLEPRRDAISLRLTLAGGQGFFTA